MSDVFTWDSPAHFTPVVTTPTIMDRLIAGTARVTRRVDILNADGSLYLAPDVVTGSVSVDISRDEWRTIDITLFDDTGGLEIDTNKLWYNKIIRPYRGLVWPGGSWEVSLGDFMPDTIGDVHRVKRRPRFRIDELRSRPTTSVKQFGLAVQITGRDFTKKMLTSKLTRPTTYVAGTAIDQIIIAEAALAGVVNLVLPWPPAFPSVAPTLTTDQPFQPETSRWEVLKTILLSFGYEMFFDVKQFLNVRLFRDPATMSPTTTFLTGEPGGNLASYQRKTDDTELFNHVVVTNESTSSATSGFFYGDVKVTDPLSPVHESQIGDRLMPEIKVASLTSNDQAIALALSYLKVAALEAFEIDFAHVVYPQLEGGEVISFIDPNASPDQLEPTNMLLTSFQIPLDLGPMNSVGKRLVIVS